MPPGAARRCPFPVYVAAVLAACGGGGGTAPPPTIALSAQAPNSTTIRLDWDAERIACADHPNRFPASARGPAWTPERVALESSRGGALAIDSAGASNFVFAGSTDLRHATDPGGAWTVGTAVAGTAAADPALARGAFDTAGRVHVIYLGRGDLRHAVTVGAPP